MRSSFDPAEEQPKRSTGETTGDDQTWRKWEKNDGLNMKHAEFDGDLMGFDPTNDRFLRIMTKKSDLHGFNMI